MLNQRMNDSENSVSATDFNHPGVALEQKEAIVRIFNGINQLSENQRTSIKKSATIAYFDIESAY